MLTPYKLCHRLRLRRDFRDELGRATAIANDNDLLPFQRNIMSPAT